MAKVRVYELARKYKISSEALIKILVKEGITVKSHMSTVEEHVEMLIEQHINRIKAATQKEVKKKVKRKEAKDEIGRLESEIKSIENVEKAKIEKAAQKQRDITEAKGFRARERVRYQRELEEIYARKRREGVEEAGEQAGEGREVAPEERPIPPRGKRRLRVRDIK